MMHRSIDELVEEQFHRWQLEQRRRAESAQPHHPKPMITFSRQHGSGGAELAQHLAERLGYSFWHKEILHEIATNSAKSERLVASFDERRRSVIAELVANLVLANRAQSDYVRGLAKVLHAIATHGGAVIVGRGAQYLLDPATVLRVLVVAPLEVRVKNLIASGHPEAEARKTAAAIDHERAEFIRTTFHHHAEDVLDYDLVLNLGHLPKDRALDVVLAALRARFGDSL